MFRISLQGIIPKYHKLMFQWWGCVREEEAFEGKRNIEETKLQEEMRNGFITFVTEKLVMLYLKQIFL